jgi:Putative beta barrel porin-7 (BBP7)
MRRSIGWTVVFLSLLTRTASAQTDGAGELVFRNVMPPTPRTTFRGAAPAPSDLQPVAAQFPVLPPPPPPDTSRPPTNWGCGTEAPRIWVSADLLAYWLKSSPVPVPVATTGDLGNNLLAGTLGAPTTQILLGAQHLDPGTFTGLQLSAGGWITDSLGLEGSLFALPRQSQGRGVASNGGGSPLLVQPYFAPPGIFVPAPGAETGNYVAIPGIRAGAISISSGVSLYGWEADGLFKLPGTEQFRNSLLFGFRQIQLNDTLQIASSSVALVPGATTFKGVPGAAGDRVFVQDQFAARNNFYGPQIGIKSSWDPMPRFGMDFIAKLGLGITSETVDINGTSTLVPGGVGPAVGAIGGLYALPTNIGVHNTGRFAAAPELEMAVRWNITQNLRLRLGYDIFWLTSVVRPGNSIDRTIDPTRVPTDFTFGFPSTASRPTFVSHDSTFWAQGFKLGVEFVW